MAKYEYFHENRPRESEADRLAHLNWRGSDGGGWMFVSSTSRSYDDGTKFRPADDLLLFVRQSALLPLAKDVGRE